MAENNHATWPSQKNYADTESWIAAIWEVLLEREVAPDEDFFDLGGDSLLAVEAAVALQEAGYSNLSVSAVLRWPTPTALASHLGERDGETAGS
jgi:acyl carrier protein